MVRLTLKSQANRSVYGKLVVGSGKPSLRVKGESGEPDVIRFEILRPGFDNRWCTMRTNEKLSRLHHAYAAVTKWPVIAALSGKSGIDPHRPSTCANLRPRNALATCYMSKFRAYNGPPSAEHLVSEGILRLIADSGEFRVGGVPWLKPDEFKVVGALPRVVFALTTTAPSAN